MIARAVVCPSPPLLARELTGRALVLPELRDACAAAVTRLVKADSEVVAVVGAGAETAAWDPDARLDLLAYAPLAGEASGALAGPGAPVGAGASARPRAALGLPLALGLGALLLDNAGYTGPRLLQAVGEDEAPAACLRLGAALAAAAPRFGLLVVGDGSARRGPSAPGHFDDRAAPFDAGVARAMSGADMAALAGLDPLLARELMATGRAAWQVLAGALGVVQPGALPSGVVQRGDPLGGVQPGDTHGQTPGDPPGAGRPTAEVLYADDPFGVAYLVAVLDPT